MPAHDWLRGGSTDIFRARRLQPGICVFQVGLIQEPHQRTASNRDVLCREGKVGSDQRVSVLFLSSLRPSPQLHAWRGFSFGAWSQVLGISADLRAPDPWGSSGCHWGRGGAASGCFEQVSLGDESRSASCQAVSTDDLSLEAQCIAKLNELVGEALSEGRTVVEAQA